MPGHDAGPQQRERRSVAPRAAPPPQLCLTSPETQPSVPRPKAAADRALRHERPPRGWGPRTERAARPSPPRARRPRRSARPLRLRPQRCVSYGHAGPVREPRRRPPRGTKARPRLRAAGTGPGRARAVNDGIEAPRLFIAPSPRRAGGVLGRQAALGGPAPTRLRPRRGPTDPGLSRSRRPRAAAAAPRGAPGPLPSPPRPNTCSWRCHAAPPSPRRGPAPPPPPPPAAAHLPRARPLAPPPPRANRRARRRDVPPRPGPVVTPPPAARPLAAPARLRGALGARGEPGARGGGAEGRGGKGAKGGTQRAGLPAPLPARAPGDAVGKEKWARAA